MRFTRGARTAPPTCAARSRATRSTSARLTPLARETARRGRSGANVPGRLPQHRRPQRRARPCLRRGDAAAHVFDRRPRARPSRPAGGLGYGVTEAPRGLLYIRYETRRRRHVRDPRSCRRRRRTSSRSRMTCAARARYARLGEDAGRRLCEPAIRNYDPCISCATHFLACRRERASCERRGGGHWQRLPR